MLWTPQHSREIIRPGCDRLAPPLDVHVGSRARGPEPAPVTFDMLKDLSDHGRMSVRKAYWTSDEAVASIARRFGITPDEVEGLGQWRLHPHDSVPKWASPGRPRTMKRPSIMDLFALPPEPRPSNGARQEATDGAAHRVATAEPPRADSPVAGPPPAEPARAEPPNAGPPPAEPPNAEPPRAEPPTAQPPGADPRRAETRDREISGRLPGAEPRRAEPRRAEPRHAEVRGDAAPNGASGPTGGGLHHLTDSDVVELRETYVEERGILDSIAEAFDLPRDRVIRLLRGEERPEAGGPVYRTLDVEALTL